VETQKRLAVVDPQKDILFIHLSRIANELSPRWPDRKSLQSCHTLSKDLLSSVGDHHPDPFKHFEAVCIYFFKIKKFKPLKSKPTLDKYLLPYALLSRRGPLELLLPLFIALCRQVHLDPLVAHYGQDIILKLLVHGKAHFFNFTKGGEPLTSEDLIALINSGSDCSHVIKEDDVLAKYLLRLKNRCLRERSFLNLYKVQTHLMSYQPFALHHLLDRARAAYAVGDIVRAAEDVSQYLSFSAQRIHNTRMIKLVRKINQHQLLKRFPFGNQNNDTQLL